LNENHLKILQRVVTSYLDLAESRAMNRRVMNSIGQLEKVTQDRVVELFQDKLDYRYLGNWEDREDNSNIEEEILTGYLKK